VSNYVQSTNFATKDNLSSGDPLKIVKGTEINTEFANIAIAVATKADLASPTFTGTPAAPTASAGNNSTQISTTAYVDAAITAVKAALFPVGAIYTATLARCWALALGRPSVRVVSWWVMTPAMRCSIRRKKLVVAQTRLRSATPIRLR